MKKSCRPLLRTRLNSAIFNTHYKKGIILATLFFAANNNLQFSELFFNAQAINSLSCPTVRINSNWHQILVSETFVGPLMFFKGKTKKPAMFSLIQLCLVFAWTIEVFLWRAHVVGIMYTLQGVATTNYLFIASCIRVISKLYSKQKFFDTALWFRSVSGNGNKAIMEPSVVMYGIHIFKFMNYL